MTYYENPTLAEMKALGDPGELIFDAKGNKQLAMQVEKAMQVHVLNHENFTQEKIKLLQLTAGNGSLRQGAPYKVGVRFLLLETIEELGFVFKGNISNKPLLFPMLPKGTILKNGDDDDSEDDVDAEDDDNVDAEDDDDGDTIDLTNESEDEDERVQKIRRVVSNKSNVRRRRQRLRWRRRQPRQGCRRRRRLLRRQP